MHRIAPNWTHLETMPCRARAHGKTTCVHNAVCTRAFQPRTSRIQTILHTSASARSRFVAAPRLCALVLSLNKHDVKCPHDEQQWQRRRCEWQRPFACCAAQQRFDGSFLYAVILAVLGAFLCMCGCVVCFLPAANSRSTSSSSNSRRQ